MGILSLSRAGKFTAATMHENDHKCGAMAFRTYTYSVQLWADGEALTPEGYILNNEHVQDFFDTHYGERAPEWDAVSCEVIAETACTSLAAYVISCGVQLKQLVVFIQGSNGALISAAWRETFVSHPPMRFDMDN